MRRVAAFASLGVAIVLVLTACTAQPLLLPSRDFDRPMDLTFVCLESVAPGATASPPITADAGTDADASATVSDASAEVASPVGGHLVSGRPMRVCHPRGEVDIADPDLHTYAFVPNSSSGELSVLDADHSTLVNLDPANAGYNRLPLGVLPSQISASDDGCRLVTANHGSCDLSVVDPAALLAPVLARQNKDPSVSSVTAPGQRLVQNVVPRAKNSGRELRLFAGEISFLPMGTDDMAKGDANLCSGDPAHQWQALVTFPSCDLVALIDLPSGIIQKAAYTRKTAGGGVALVPFADGEDPVCPVSDCQYPPADGGAASDAAAQAPSDASPDAASDATPLADQAGATAHEPYVGPGGLRPGPIAIIPESGRAYVGLANAAYVLSLNVDQNVLSVPAGGGAIPLHEGALGVNRLRLSIDPYKYKTAGGGGKPGSFIGSDPSFMHEYLVDRQYLYAIARDGTLRVVQVAHLPETECETNVDFGLITDPAAKDLELVKRVSMDATARANAMKAACPAVVGPSTRRPGAVGPGIRLPTPPIDVAVADVSPPVPDVSETSVTGTHAWVLAASGSVYLVNINPGLRNISWVETNGTPCEAATPACHAEDEPAPNTLRNRNFLGYTLSLDPSQGLPRLDVPPTQATIGPRIESVWTRGSIFNATSLTNEFIKTSVMFPDPTAPVPQTWAVTWEGNLMATPRASGQIRTGSLLDLGMDFCRLGVQNDDIVTVTGCTDTIQCGIGKTCVFGSNGEEGTGGLPITGLCLTAASQRPSCDAFLSTVKRYDVTSAQQSELGLIPHKDELVRPALWPCKADDAPSSDGGVDAKASDGGVDAADARPDAGSDGGLASQLSDRDRCVDTSDPNTNNFKCVAGRCLSPCTTPGETTGCRTGRICVAYGAKTCVDNNCFCADAPPINERGADAQICLGELFPYQVSVGRGFLVSGTQSGIPSTGIADATTGLCGPRTDLDPRVVVRIPMNAPQCVTPADNHLDSRCDPNPNSSNTGCATDPTATALALTQQLYEPSNPNPCQLMGGPNETDISSSQQPHVRAIFKNREVQFMMTNLERPPSGKYQIHFDVHGGTQPQTVAIPSTVEVTMPARLVLSPFDSNAQPTLPGPTAEAPYLFVVDQRRLGRTQGGGPTRGQLLRINPRGFTVTLPVTGQQPWYEDLSHSANLFPIQ